MPAAMRTSLRVFSLTVALALLSNGNAGAQSAATCRVVVLAEARWSGYAFNHLVHVVNYCAEPIDCVVSTDVNPQEQTVTVDANTDMVVNTFFGSPARVFSPRATCTRR
jgi:hypothetical protein